MRGGLCGRGAGLSGLPRGIALPPCHLPFPLGCVLCCTKWVVLGAEIVSSSVKSHGMCTPYWQYTKTVGPHGGFVKQLYQGVWLSALGGTTQLLSTFDFILHYVNSLFSFRMKAHLYGLKLMLQPISIVQLVLELEESLLW